MRVFVGSRLNNNVLFSLCSQTLSSSAIAAAAPLLPSSSSSSVAAVSLSSFLPSFSSSCRGNEFGNLFAQQRRNVSYDARNHRISLFNELQTKYLQDMSAAAAPIRVKVDGHSSLKVESHVTAPGMLLRGIDYKHKVIACRVDGTLWDLRRPLEQSCAVKFLRWDEHWDELMEISWHSGAHIVGAAMEELFGDDLTLCDGPPLQRGTQGGFYYEGLINGGKTLTKSVLKELNPIIARYTQTQSTFHRIVVSVDEARDVFRHNPFKLHFLSKIAAGGVSSVSLYRVGKFVDLCEGPHLANGQVLQKSIELTKTARAEFNWSGRESDKPQGMEDVVDMQRLYGMCYPNRKVKKIWREHQKQLEKIRHPQTMKELDLVLMHPHSPGAPFFLPHGVRLVERLKQMLRRLYVEYNYDEVMTPLVYSQALWETSGHWDHYRNDMYKVTGFDEGDKPEEQEKGLKPMNCPAHCLVYASKQRSYKDLPLRLSEFTALHRNEPSGGLTGLTRVRQFHQDDAHIFCTLSQIAEEVEQCLSFVQRVYARCGFDYRFALSTRPDDFVGDAQTWDIAEEQLKQCLTQHGMPFTVHEGDGAFYGPKIDIYLRDVFRREHQTATIQLDFQLPQRFDLTFVPKRKESDGEERDEQTHRPVIIHRAVLGSIERMMAMLLENTHGRLPLWCNPRQVACMSVTSNANEATMNLVKYLRKNNIYAEEFLQSDSIGKKIRRAIKERFSYVIVVGEKEVNEKVYTVKPRDEEHRIEMLPRAVQDILLDDKSSFQPEEEVTAEVFVERIQKRMEMEMDVK
eukprot:m.135899 g.135899  ORF g.135899 m.135899 type:complete len:797 (-) comp13128_c3_seq3:73-2463(-)